MIVNLIIGTAAGLAIVPAATRSSVVASVIEMSGDNPRVIVKARINGHEMDMMVHSSARLFGQLRHGQAAAFHVRLAPGTHRDYGINRDGHVSDLGRDDGHAVSLAVGRSVNRNVPLTVFEVPQAKLGMLGTGWITANRVVVDFAHQQVRVAPTAAETSILAKSLLRNGYVPIPMIYDKTDHVYLVEAKIGGLSRKMVVATSSAFEIDTVFADAIELKRGEDRGGGGGPTGTHVPEYTLKTPVRVMIGDWTSPLLRDGRISDEYAYIAAKRPTQPALARGGMLGGAFLRQTGAVIDFGARTLFVRR